MQNRISHARRLYNPGVFSTTGTPMKHITLILIAAFALAGCNTMEGIGRDVKKGGEAIERAAK